MTRIPAIILSATSFLALSACELRRDGDAPVDPEANEAPGDPAVTPTAEPEPEETPAVSIIRDEAPPADEPEPVEPLTVTVPFADGGNDMDAAALAALREVLESDALREGWPVILRGHTDSSGNDSANLRASRSRAEAVAAWLVERGVDDDRITVIAFGEQNPIAPNARPDGSPNEAGRARNRRVDIEIAPVTLPPAGAASGSNDDA
ncbi:OmpA family protein [Alteraurantiacibacter aquimixticola]|nr:OmpA family protein [Alteraurantiacibacter aquimixticola]